VLPGSRNKVLTENCCSLVCFSILDVVDECYVDSHTKLTVCCVVVCEERCVPLFVVCEELHVCVHLFVVCEVRRAVPGASPAARLLPQYFPHYGQSGPHRATHGTPGDDAPVRDPHLQRRRI
jgi:hypothetical protein